MAAKPRRGGLGPGQLTARQRLFVQEYLIDLNASAAATSLSTTTSSSD